MSMMPTACPLGYDPADVESDEDEEQSRTRRQGQQANSRRNEVQKAEPLMTTEDMDKLDIATLKRLDWLEPLGYRALSNLTGLPTSTLRQHFWCSKVKRSSPLSADINHYFNNSNSHNFRMRIKRVTELKRFNENNCDYKVPNVRLLWHGTQTANVRGILTNGFRLPTHSGMFGPGVYFADRVSKSSQYCGTNGIRGSSGVLFLCAVNLGRMYKSTTAMNVRGPPQGYDSVKGCGVNVPDRRDIRFHRGAMIPCGKTVRSDNARGAGLVHNEYIVYDLSKIAVLFLVEFEYV